MTSRPKPIPITVMLSAPDYEDLQMILRRTRANLYESINEALHIGVAAYVDKWEAVFAAEPRVYPMSEEDGRTVGLLHRSLFPINEDGGIVAEDVTIDKGTSW